MGVYSSSIEVALDRDIFRVRSSPQAHIHIHTLTHEIKTIPDKEKIEVDRSRMEGRKKVKKKRKMSE